MIRKDGPSRRDGSLVFARALQAIDAWSPGHRSRSGTRGDAPLGSFSRVRAPEPPKTLERDAAEVSLIGVPPGLLTSGYCRPQQRASFPRSTSRFRTLRTNESPSRPGFPDCEIWRVGSSLSLIWGSLQRGAPPGLGGVGVRAVRHAPGPCCPSAGEASGRAGWRGGRGMFSGFRGIA